MKADTVLISPSFIKVWTWIAGLTITQAQKISVLQVAVSDEDACDQNDKPSNRSSLPPTEPIAINSIPY